MFRCKMENLPEHNMDLLLHIPQIVTTGRLDVYKRQSSVTVSIVLLMASQGLLSLPICFFIILGCNMGSCVSALLASLSGNKGAKRAAMIHFLFNVFGSIIIFTGLSIALEPITNFFLSISGGNLGRSVANAHTTFKIIEVLFMFPCTPLVVALTEKIIPGEDQKVHHNELQYITETVSYTHLHVFFPKTYICSVSNDNMVTQWYSKKLSCFFHALRCENILPAWCWITRWMIMDH